MAVEAGSRADERTWFDRSAVDVGRDLLGARIVHGEVAGRIVEVEAYAGPEDLASHAARGHTPRNHVMFGPPGHLYVYLVYGLHHCINVVTGPGTKPEAVLIRALEIERGRLLARARRGPRPSDRALASGPGNVAKALAIDRSQDGIDLLDGPVRIERRHGPAPRMASGPRVGVGYAGAWAARRMRFWCADDPHVSGG